jgi:hypothetical protein
MIDDQPLMLKVTLYDHLNIKTLGVRASDDLNTKNWKIGDTIEMTVVGIERRTQWEGLEVR